MAVGEYDSGGYASPLVYTWAGGRLVQRSAPLNPGEHGYFNSVSCQSASFCVAVGGNVGPSSLAEVWNGSGFTERQGGAGSGRAFLNQVSCASAGSFCMAVGYVDSAAGQNFPYLETYDGNGWVAQSNTSDGRFVLQPSTGFDPILTGVYCLNAVHCEVVGNYYTAGPNVNPWGAELNGSWTLSSPPPSNADAGFGNGSDLVCPSTCWAVGNYASGKSLQLFADNLNGSQWGFSSLPGPGGPDPGLSAVSCAQINYCEAVGSYDNNATRRYIAFAERYSYTPPPGGKCTDPDCPPPKPGTPHQFSLGVHGTERNGATITVVLRKPRALVLLVRGARHHHPMIIGLVALGNHPAGTSRIHWDVRVGGRLLGAGTYEVSLHSIANNVLSPDTPPGETTLTVQRNKRLRIAQ
jgi:hypothetical protein